MKFNAVGVLGIGVQLAVLTALKSGAGFNYLVATVIAVEAAVLHNFFWHEHWTWIERTRSASGGMPSRLARFHVTNGLISIAGNLTLMWVLVSRLQLHYFLANIMAIATCSILNFFASDRLVFGKESTGGIRR
jgi:putative flippase GtrA